VSSDNIQKFISKMRITCVSIANWCGWLSFVDADIIQSYRETYAQPVKWNLYPGKTFFRRRIFLNLLKICEILIMLLCLFLSIFVFSFGTMIPSFSLMEQLEINTFEFVFIFCAIFSWLSIFSNFNLYHSRRFSNVSKEIKDVLKATVIGAALILITAIILRIDSITLRQIIIFWICCFTVTISNRIMLRYFVRWLRTHGRNLSQVVIVGTNSRAIDIAKKIVSVPEVGYHFLGFVDDEWIGLENFRRTGHHLVCDLRGFQDFIRAGLVDEVIFALPIKSFYNQAHRMISICTNQGVSIRILSRSFSTFDQKSYNSQSDLLGDYSVITVSDETLYGHLSTAKRIIDFILASILFLILLPFFPIVAIAIKLSSPGPIFFIQERIGYGKRIFRLYKFRTMSEHSEEWRTGIEELSEASGPVFKMKEDPRITTIGKYLRKSSIDEWPQLINVIKGDMSIVGPRPLPVRDYKEFNDDWIRRRFSVRPGLTCPWQIKGKKPISSDEWKLDMEYVDKWTLWLDLKIFFKTIPIVLKGS
jgi:exopolysaccharide biosynthesis polyprenyl glycosylphosphotransferase